MQKTTWLSAYAVAVTACIGVWGLTAWTDRRTVIDAAEAKLAATAHLLEQHADRTLEAGDQALRAVVQATGDPHALDASGAEALYRRLREVIRSNSPLSAAWIADADGRVVAETYGFPARDLPPLVGREYFVAHRSGETGLHIGPTAISAGAARPRFTLSRPILGATGDLEGVAVIGVFSGYFGDVFAEAGLGRGARFALFRNDGPALAAWPLPVLEEAVPPDLPASPAFGWTSLQPGRATLTAARRLERFPAVLVVSQPVAELLVEWRARTLRNGVATLAAVATLSLLTWLGLRGAARQRALTLALRQERSALERRVADRTAALAESEARFREMADNAPVMVWVTDAAGLCVFLSRSWYDFTGQTREHALGMGWLDAVHPEDSAMARTTFIAATEQGAPFRVEYRLRRASDGAWRWAIDAAAPRRGPDGEFLGHVGSVIDITERREAEERQALMARELDHRAKNALTVVQAALRLTPRSDVQSYAAAVEGRVAALARAHSVLAEGRWQGVALRTLVEAELAAFLSPSARAPAAGHGPRVRLAGPALLLLATAVQALSMALHELATNATKYGALSVPGGWLEVAWSIDQATETLRLDWTETGGPAPSGPPAHRGFGSRVIEATLTGQLGGTVERRWEPAGLSCRITLPMARVTLRGTAPAANDVTAMAV